MLAAANLITLLLLPTHTQAQQLPPMLYQLLLSDESTSPNDSTRFGALPLNSSARPTRDWINAFNSATPIPLNEPLQDAIDSCSGMLPCVILIDQLNLSETIYINKSSVKLLGKAGNKITYNGTDSIFLIESNTSNIILEGLEIDGRINNIPAERNPDIYAINLYGNNISQILIKDNYIHHLDGKQNAHGIAALGTGATEQSAISNLIIESNRLEDLRTGSSESIVVNGNVSHWEIIDNDVSRVNNIAIDAIGGEGTSPTQTVNGRIVPGELDVARFGFIENNRITSMSTLDNPAYGSKHSYAAGIYLDGAQNVLVTNNTVSDTPWAIEVGAENCVETANISVINNQTSESRFGDLLIGGYAIGGFVDNLSINCDPNTSEDSDEGHGYVRYTTVKANNFDSSDTLEDTIELSNRIRNTIIIAPNINPINTDGIATGDQNSIRVSE
ncbi:hypothetical protein DFR28_101127 [Arenicella xantha]|uniref:Parallel beta helix pectate lyase-like protein n=2 Tax=Arenicella xantha TaxID=644221 RepID=A0A395JQ47_9GAMM|nr:hypothetical protein DFR28_101127 [Arenicella xantha]